MCVVLRNSNPRSTLSFISQKPFFRKVNTVSLRPIPLGVVLSKPLSSRRVGFLPSFCTSIPKRNYSDKQKQSLIQEYIDKVNLYRSGGNVSPSEMDNILKRLSSLIPPKTIPNIKSRWLDYTITDVQALPGFNFDQSTKDALFSTANAVKASNIINNLMHRYIKPLVVEIGGFAHSDAFMFQEQFKKNNIKISEYIGVDIYYKGILAAKIYNDHFAKIQNCRFIHNTAEAALTQLTESHYNKDKVVIALRFLAVLQPHEINSFFRSLKNFMNINDLFMFDYTAWSEKIALMARNSLYCVSHSDDGIYFLQKNNVYIQTFFTHQKINKLLEENGFEIIPKPDFSAKDKSQIRQPLDKYSRYVVAALRR